MLLSTHRRGRPRGGLLSASREPPADARTRPKPGAHAAEWHPATL